MDTKTQEGENVEQYTIGKFKKIGSEGYEGTILREGKAIGEFINYGNGGADTIRIYTDRDEVQTVGEQIKAQPKYHMDSEVDSLDAFFRVLLDRYSRLKEKEKYTKKGYPITMIGVTFSDLDREYNLPGFEYTIAGINLEEVKKAAKRMKCEKLYEIANNGDLGNEIALQ